LKQEWLGLCLAWAREPAEFYSGARKIIRNRHWTLDGDALNEEGDSLEMTDAGYRGTSKLRQLERNYIHSESREMATVLWEGRLKRGKYGSVGFHCFGHYIKGTNTNYWEWNRRKKASDEEKREFDIPRSKRASVMGPCIQAVAVTLLNNGNSSVDLYYRTTELFKKFPADLVFIRDSLLEPFDFSSAPIQELNFHFANVTCHPMYFVTLLPLVRDPVRELRSLKKDDKYFHDWAVKWTARYLCDEYMRGIENFQQAMRVRRDALEKLSGRKLDLIRKYLRDNHPGYRNDRKSAQPIDEDDDD
jgi:hypothetical protein